MAKSGRARLFGLALAAAASYAPGDGALAQDAPAPAVVAAEAVISDIRPRLSFSGRLVAVRKVDLRARVAGFLRENGFREGARVAAGDVLFRIEDDPYVAVAEQIRAAIGAAEAERRLAEIERDRKATLVAREAAPQSELDIAIANLAGAESEIERLRAELARAELDVSYTRVAAPFDGVIGLSAFDVGALVGPDSSPLATLTQLDPMTVEVPIAAALVQDYLERRARGEAQRGVSVTLTLPNGAAYDRTGTVDFIDAEVAPGTDTVLVRAVFDNPDGLLLDGGLVSVALEQAEPELVLNIPRRAVQRDQVGDFVLVVGADEAVELRRVTVARTTRDRAVIAEGLAEGERVITEGLNKVRPGVVVDATLASES